ncbi:MULTISPECIES: hypothetical protein [Kamptonema]|nr:MULTISPECIES: hypothetical protein [Kamptonema]
MCDAFGRGGDRTKSILQSAASPRAIAIFPPSPGEAGMKAKTLTN